MATDSLLQALQSPPASFTDTGVRVGYVSAALRVSTRFDAVSSGARAHILGFVNGVRELGMDVDAYILGDHLPSRSRTLQAEFRNLHKVSALASDVARLALRPIIPRLVRHHFGHSERLIYERFASFQAVGRMFQRKGWLWVLETNGPFYEEASVERKSMVLSGVAKSLELRAYRQCDLLVCVSSSLRDIVMREACIPASKILVVPNGVDTRWFDPDRHRARRLNGKFTVGFVGRLNSWQGLDLLIHAIAELKKERAADIALTVVGDGVMRSEWEALAHELDITATFVGQVPFDQVPGYICGFDVAFSGQVLMRSGVMYHSPLKIYEYMAMKKPVVASAFDDSQCALRNRETGFLFTPGYKDGLKAALLAGFIRRDHLSQLGEQARTCVIGAHSWSSRVKDVFSAAQALRERRPWTA